MSGSSVAKEQLGDAKSSVEGSELRPTFHELKTWARYFDAVADGRKTFEVRKNDRAFQTGDHIDLVKVENDYPHHYVTPPGRRFGKIALRRRITYVLQGGQFGIEPSFCVLGLSSPLSAITSEQRDCSTAQSAAGNRDLPPGYEDDLTFLDAALSTYAGGPAAHDVDDAWRRTVERIRDLWSDYLRRNEDAAARGLEAARLRRTLSLAHQLCLSTAPRQAVGEVLAHALSDEPPPPEASSPAAGTDPAREEQPQ